MYDNGAWLHFTDRKLLRGTKPEAFAWHRHPTRFFLTVNSAGDRKRPIQKEGGLNERENN
jgi:hypothetical protein